ncbi:MAG: hypothetical protein R3B13_00340 [Polyangiaceae bacterium]
MRRIVAYNPRISLSSAAAAFRVVVRLSATHDGYLAQVRLHADGTDTLRELPGRDCDEVQRAAALVVGVLAENAMTLRSIPPPPASESAPRPMVQRHFEPEPRPQPSASAWIWGGGIQLAADTGLGPDTAFFPRPFVSLSRDVMSLRLGAGVARTVADTEQGRAALSWVLLRAEGCYELRAPGSWLGPCAGLEAGTVAASGSRTREAREETLASYAGVVSARGGWELLGGLALEVEAGVRVPFARHRFFFAEDAEAYEMPGAAFSSAVGLHFRTW